MPPFVPDKKWCEDGFQAGHGSGFEAQRYMVARFRIKPYLQYVNGKDFREGKFGRSLAGDTVYTFINGN